jgi:hypothetical protein
METDVFLPPVSASTAAQPAYFRKGVLLAFNPATGANTVNVAGANLTNLPILVSGSETAFTVGQTVGIMVVGTSMFIVGRIAIPGSAAYASTTSALAYATGSASAFSLAWPGFVTLVSAVLTVPSWASKAAIFCVTRGAVKNTRGSVDNLQTNIVIPGGVSPLAVGNVVGVPDTYFASLSYANVDVVPVTPGGTITTRFDVAVGAAWGSDPSNGIVMTAIGIFTTT